MKIHCRSWDGRFWIYLYAGPLRLTLFRMKLWHRRRRLLSLALIGIMSLGIVFVSSHADDVITWLASSLSPKGHHR